MCAQKAIELLRNVHHSQDGKAFPHQRSFPSHSDQSHCPLQSELSFILKTSTWAPNTHNSVLTGERPRNMGLQESGGDSGRRGVARDHQDKASDKTLQGCHAKTSREGVKLV